MGFTKRFIGSTDISTKHIVIDWSDMEDTEQDIDSMIGWVQSYPNRSDIHVYLGKARQRMIGRKLQGALQSLGCTVTTRQFIPAAV